ncbi:sigma 54-interacting transcriptional regulator [Pseudomonas sp. R5(2019)]|uniref:sigma 54-interacting transcriptional regulator n=1 Tax=Pseudomonas sp. R5(2019) TaxID=2697566 RepID=UPI0021140F64|nr:sigma-54 dependent transcriptional regulator [Pseudomonas sp. R5(2019)]
MEELDNPLVYCLLTGKACLIERKGALVDVGAGYEALRERLVEGDALIALPLFDSQRKAMGVLALSGAHSALLAWREDGVWQELVQLHEILMAQLHAQQGAKALAHHQRAEQLQREVAQGRSRTRLLAAGFIGVGATARRLREDMLRLADSSLSLLITGETGSGKDHAAMLIHQASSREGKFVPVNCAAIPKDLIEAELFGAALGAYTGAKRARTGLVAEAHGGTLFLDEIGDMPLPLQGTLLRLLNEKKFRPVGTTREQTSDFRLICATHRPLPDMVRDGHFREDLYFRIRQQVLHIPPLCERPEDIPALVSHVLLEHNRVRKARVAGISASAVARLQAYGFPGNVRELRSLVLSAAERTPPGKRIRINLLAELEVKPQKAATEQNAQAAFEDLWRTDSLPKALATFERLLLDDRLNQVSGSRRQAALSLGIPKRTLARKCLDWNLKGKDS